MNLIVGEARLRGPAGSAVKLEIIRGGQPDPILLQVERLDVLVSPVTFELREGSIGYIKVTGFRAGTDTDVKRAIEMLKGQGADKLAIDVRNSYGRLAEDGAKVAELFVPGGVAARLQSRKGETTDVTLASDPAPRSGASWSECRPRAGPRCRKRSRSATEPRWFCRWLSTGRRTAKRSSAKVSSRPSRWSGRRRPTTKAIRFSTKRSRFSGKRRS
jgi:hypothetical protein